MLHLLSCVLKQNTSSEMPNSGKLNQQETLIREKAGGLFLDFLYSMCALLKHKLINSAEWCEKPCQICRHCEEDSVCLINKNKV